MTQHDRYMHRCLQLAKLGQGCTTPNPMVGAVLVYDNKIIGEGYHQQYGEAHAEVHCMHSVPTEELQVLHQSTMYVSLEPCAHFGKTPPCADLIIRHRIPNVIIGCRDPFVQVNGKGIEKLIEAGVAVEVGILEKECIALNKRFFTFHQQHRPYITLKWAQTLNAKIAHEDYSRVFISNAYTNRLVHKWRSEEAAILVGTNTALFDDPELTTRLWPGNNPIRLVVDLNLRLPQSLKLFQAGIPTLVFNLHRHTIPVDNLSVGAIRETGVTYYQVTSDVSLVHQIIHALYQLNIQSVLVEGGTHLLQSFIDEGIWDEARTITNEELVIGNGLPAPSLKDHTFQSSEQLSADTIRTYAHQRSQ